MRAHTAVERKHRRQTVVKFMIAEGDEVVAERVEHRHLHFTAVDVEIGCALHYIAGINEDYVGTRGADAVNYNLSAQDATFAIEIGVDLGVGVVGVENDKCVVGSSDRESRD